MRNRKVKCKLLVLAKVMVVIMSPAQSLFARYLVKMYITLTFRLDKVIEKAICNFLLMFARSVTICEIFSIKMYRTWTFRMGQGQT